MLYSLNREPLMILFRKTISSPSCATTVPQLSRRVVIDREAPALLSLKRAQSLIQLSHRRFNFSSYNKLESFIILFFGTFSYLLSWNIHLSTSTDMYSGPQAVLILPVSGLHVFSPSSSQQLGHSQKCTELLLLQKCEHPPLAPSKQS